MIVSPKDNWQYADWKDPIMSKENLIRHEEARQKRWEDPEYRKEYRRLKPRYDVVREILRLRHSLGLTQKQLADKAATHQSRVSRIETGEDDFRISTLVSVAEALGADVEIRLVQRPRREFYAEMVEILAAIDVKPETAATWDLPSSKPLFVKEKVFS